MKRLLLFAFFSVLCIFCVSCESVRIVMNTLSPEGERTILTSDRRVGSYKGGRIMVALGLKMSPKDTLMAVLVTCDANSNHGIFDRNDRIMVRLSDSTEFELRNMYDKEFESSTETNTTTTIRPEYVCAYTYSPWTGSVYLTPYSVNVMVPTVYTVKTTNSYGLYPLTLSQLDALTSQPALKFRIETEDSDVDLPYPGNIAGIFMELRECLKEAVLNPVQRTKF